PRIGSTESGLGRELRNSADSPSKVQSGLSAGSASTSSQRSTAMASTSKPGPRLAMDAGTRTRKAPLLSVPSSPSRAERSPTTGARHAYPNPNAVAFASPSPLTGEYIPGVLGVKQQPPREGWSRREPRRKGGGGEGN